MLQPTLLKMPLPQTDYSACTYVQCVSLITVRKYDVNM